MIVLAILGGFALAVFIGAFYVGNIEDMGTNYFKNHPKE